MAHIWLNIYIYIINNNIKWAKKAEKVEKLEKFTPISSFIKF